MNEFINKQKKLKKIKNALIISAAALVFIYIGIQPMLEDVFSNSQFFQIILFFIVITVIGFEFYYDSKYASAEKFLDDVFLQLNDAGCYLTSREEKEPEDYLKVISDDLAECGYKSYETKEFDGLEFDALFYKGNEYLYCVLLDSTDRNFVIAYTDAARNDLIQNKLKRKGECVVLFLCNSADEGAINLSKSFSRSVMSRYNVITVSPAIVDTSTSKVYFLGNRVSSAQKLIINNVMNCEIPLKDKYKISEKIEFQRNLEEDLKDFNIKDFKSGKYNER